jgi:hypothetical protein
MTDKLYVNTTHYQEVTRCATEPEWDRDDTYTSWTVDGVSLSKNTGWEQEEVPVDFGVEKGDTVYLLYAIYSTGDSFGRDDCANLENILIFKDHEKAEAAKKAIRNHYDRCNRWYDGDDKIEDFNQQFSLMLKTETGLEYELHVPWTGYFESLDRVEVEPFVVEK